MAPSYVYLFILSVGLVQESTTDKYEGETCVDHHSHTTGECCVLHACRSALDDLRHRRREPALCSFMGNTPVVCCRGGCSSFGGGGGGDGGGVGGGGGDGGGGDDRDGDWTADTPATQTEPTRLTPMRKSEMMCAALDGAAATPRMFVPRTASSKKTKRRRNLSRSNRHCRSANLDPDEQSGGIIDSNDDLGNSNSSRGIRGHTSSNGGRAKVKLGNGGLADDSGTVHTAAVGGENTGLYEFPHMAALGWPKKTGGFAFLCGGSLISDRFVMTAGHCLSNSRDTSLASSEPTIVRLGDQNILDSIVDGAEPADVPMEAVFRHKLYRPPNKYYDIALLKLKTSVTFSDHVRPVCLWTRTDFGNYTTAIVTGWGTTMSGGRENSAELQKVKVNILDTAVCQPLLQSAWNRNWRGFSEHQLCAGVLEGGKDACQGDSGGPLQVRSPSGKYHVIGVTAFGRECGKRNQPGVYTRVSAFIDWIESVVWPTEA